MPKGNKGILRKSIGQRFAEHTTDGPNGCIEWTGKIQRRIDGSDGYGLAMILGKDRYAHRVSYEFHVGPIPPGLDVCHQCDNRRCVNPQHLYLGTRADNLGDAARKGRMAKKLTLADAGAIKGLLRDGVHPTVVAGRFGVARSMIYSIQIGKSWRSVEAA